MLVGTQKLGDRITIPRQAQPPKPIIDSFHSVLGRTFAIRIFNSEKKGATIAVTCVVLRKEPIEKGSPGAANMQKSGGGGGESSDDAHFLARMLHKVISRLEAFITYFRSCSNAMKIFFIG